MTMPWTGWVCITVLITYCLAQETSQYNPKLFTRNPTLYSIQQDFPADLESDINNAISIQLMNNMNQRSLSSSVFNNFPTQSSFAVQPQNDDQSTQFLPNFSQNAQFQSNFGQNAQFQPNYGQNGQLRPVYSQNVQFQPNFRLNGQLPNNNRNAQFQPNNPQSQWNLQPGVGNSNRFGQSQTSNRGGFWVNRNDDDDDDENETTWKDYFENSIDWLACERWANGITFLKSLVTEDVFREWAISQLCQDAMFAFLVPPVLKMVGFDYEAWEF